MCSQKLWTSEVHSKELFTFKMLFVMQLFLMLCTGYCLMSMSWYESKSIRFFKYEIRVKINKTCKTSRKFWVDFHWLCRRGYIETIGWRKQKKTEKSKILSLCGSFISVFFYISVFLGLVWETFVRASRGRSCSA